MMPWESWNARDAALLRIERASARTMEEEMAARWWGKKDWGEERPSSYTVESTPSVPCAALASSLRRRKRGAACLPPEQALATRPNV